MLLDNVLQTPWPFWVGGIVIGLLVPLMYYFFNTPLGVSTGYGNLVKILFRGSKLQWIESKFPETWSWRVYFIVGIIAGAFLSARGAGMPWFTMEMGTFTSMVSWAMPLQALHFFVGGIFLGLGARIAGGCTSGHSIHGIANAHFSSILVTALFLLGGIVSANLLRVILFGGMG